MLQWKRTRKTNGEARSLHGYPLQPAAQPKIGTLPRRSAVDLVGCLVHDVEKAWSNGKVASLLVFDVQGAFETVFADRIQARLRDQG